MDIRQYNPEQGIIRLLDYYHYVTAAAGARIASHSPPPVPATPTSPVPDLTDYQQALARASAERGNVVAWIERAGPVSPGHAVALTAALAHLLRIDGPWSEAAALHRAAAETARRLGDQPAEAGALCSLAEMQRLAG